MFCKYQISSTPNQTNLANDLRDLITGQTDKQALSSNCDKTNTEIFSTVLAGWELHDQVSATKFVVKAKEANGILDKFVMLEVLTTSITFSCYETWNAVTHTGTNLIGTATSITIALSATTKIYLGVKKQYLMLHALNNTTWSAIASASMEMTRDDPWNTPELGYPAHIFARHLQYLDWGSNGATITTFHLPRLKTDTTDLTGNNAWMQFICPFTATLNPSTLGGANRSMTWTGGGAIRGANFTDIIIPVFDFGVFRVKNDVSLFYRGGTIIGGLKVMPGTYGNDGDDIVYDGKTYFLITALSGGNNRMSPTLLIPKE